MALDYRQNFVSAQYLENELTELDQISRPDIAYGYCQNFVSAPCERTDGISSNFVNALTITSSNLGLLRANFHKFITVMAILSASGPFNA